MIYIGGASASGKSTAARKLSGAIGLKVIELDAINRKLRKQHLKGERLNDETRRLSRSKIEKLLTSNTNCIVEGGWVRPDVASELAKQYGQKLVIIYVGYPHAKVNEHLDKVLAGKVHWLCRRPEEEALTWVQRQIQNSSDCEKQCKEYGFRFIDFSDQEAGTKELMSNFKESRSIMNKYKFHNISNDFSQLLQKLCRQK